MNNEPATNREDNDNLDNIPSPAALTQDNATYAGTPYEHSDDPSEEKSNEVDKISNAPRNEQQDRRAARANDIALIGVIINVFLISITLAAFWQTKRAVDISADTLRYAMEKDSVDAIQEVRREERTIKYTDSSLSISNNNTKIAKASVNAQIDEMKGAANQFDATNQPFFSIGEFRLTPLVIGEEPSVLYDIENITNIPAQVTGNRSSFRVKIIEELPDSVRKATNQKFSPANTYVIKDISYSQKTPTGRAIDESSYTSLSSGKHYIYFFKQIRYINLITKKRRIFEFYVRLKPIHGSDIFPSGTYFEVLYINNQNDK